jgi:hypothetical protein
MVPAGQKAESAKHLDEELPVRPLPSTGRERRAEIRERAKLNGLLISPRRTGSESRTGSKTYQDEDPRPGHGYRQGFAAGYWTSRSKG